MQLNLDAPGPLTRIARAQGWINPAEEVQYLQVAGAGNMNRVLRGHLNSSRTLIFKQSLPYVAKYPDIPAPIERLDVEALFYKTIHQDAILRASTPTVLGYDLSNHLLCLQDLGAGQDYSFLYAPDDQTPTEKFLPALLNWLSHLHHLELSPEQALAFANPAMRALNHSHIFVIPFEADNGVTLDEGLISAAAGLRGDHTLMARIADLGDLYLGRLPISNAPRLLHGDFYPGSWMLDTTAQLKVIDPEFAFFGPAEFDVGVMFAHLTLAGFNRDDLLNQLAAYRAGPGFNLRLAWQFAGVEIMRRLLGVAQLPLHVKVAQKLGWLDMARSWL